MVFYPEPFAVLAHVELRDSCRAAFSHHLSAAICFRATHAKDVTSTSSLVVERVAVGLVANESPKSVVARVFCRIAEQQIDAVSIACFRAEIAAVSHFDCVPTCIREVGCSCQTGEHQNK